MNVSDIDDAALKALRDDWGGATQDERIDLLRSALLRHALQMDLVGVAIDALRDHSHHSVDGRVLVDIGG